MIEIKNLRNRMPQETYDVAVDRRHTLGNPFYMNNESERDRVCNAYDSWLKAHVDNKNPVIMQELKKLADTYKRFKLLRLFCWCSPKRCHAESIREQVLNLIKLEEQDNV